MPLFVIERNYAEQLEVTRDSAADSEARLLAERHGLTAMMRRLDALGLG